MLTLAIQPDKQLLMSGRRQSFSSDWVERARTSGIGTRLVNVYDGNLRQQLDGCDGFLWWFAHLPEIRNVGTRVIQAIGHGMRLPTFPNRRTIWHFDDKLAQAYLLDAAGIPMPATWIFWRRGAAREFARTARYPLVMKLAGGIVSENVRRVDSADEAAFWIEQLFGPGVTSLSGWPPAAPMRQMLRRVRDARKALLGRSVIPTSRRVDLQRGYVLFQELVPGNEFDTRVTVIGGRAFAFRRFNRPDDFRASGSGRIDWDSGAIDLAAVTLAFQVAAALGTQSLAVDVLRSTEGRLVLTEISYYYEGRAVHDCPGHWTPDLTWHPGHVAPEDAIFDDFVQSISAVAASAGVLAARSNR
jgi:glutathione synthase/RimK-type ligase-like ATP-grasp enzyme